MNDDMRINFNERLEDNSEIKVTENALTENRKLSILEDDYSDDLEQMLEKTEKKQRQYVYFSGKADVNSDYGKGGGNQYFIQNASFLKEKGNLVAIDREICKYNPETDLYSPDIRDKNGLTIHFDNRPLMKEEIQQLDSSTSEGGKQNTDEWEYKLTKEELKQLDENAPNVEWLTRNPPGWEKEDFDHPAGNQEDSNGKNHPDGWTNPQELKDGTIFYQLLPDFRSGKETKTPYFTDKETVDSCRDENGKIILSALMQKLQKEPNKEELIDSEGNIYEIYVEEYSVVQYKFKKNISTE